MQWCSTLQSPEPDEWCGVRLWAGSHEQGWSAGFIQHGFGMQAWSSASSQACVLDPSAAQRHLLMQSHVPDLAVNAATGAPWVQIYGPMGQI